MVSQSVPFLPNLLLNYKQPFKNYQTMKKTIAMIALAAMSFGSVYAAVPVKTITAVADTAAKKKVKTTGTTKKVKMKTDTSKVKKKATMKKDTTTTKTKTKTKAPKM